MQAIEMKHVCFTYGKRTILDDLCCVFPQGKMAMVLGRNGSGKSTLFNILTGIQLDYEGEITINSIDRRTMKRGKHGTLRIGFMNQFHQTTFPFSVFDVVLTGRAAFSRFAPSKIDRLRVKEILGRFDLLRYSDKPYTALSGGERQLVLLCRVLVQDPDIILLDEPTNHLDLHYQIALLDHLKEMVEAGKTVVCIMHDPNLAFQYGDCFYVMDAGKLTDLSDASPEAVHRELEQAYAVKLYRALVNDKPIMVPKSRLAR